MVGVHALLGCGKYREEVCARIVPHRCFVTCTITTHILIYIFAYTHTHPQVLLLIRQMESTTTPATLSKVSMLTIGQQAIMDAYLCLMHLTVGMCVGVFGCMVSV